MLIGIQNRILLEIKIKNAVFSLTNITTSCCNVSNKLMFFPAVSPFKLILYAANAIKQELK